MSSGPVVQGPFVAWEGALAPAEDDASLVLWATGPEFR